MPKRKPILKFNEFLALANLEISAKLLEACDAAYLERAHADAERTATVSLQMRLLTTRGAMDRWREFTVESLVDTS
jgi:hypothetical protein